MKQSRVPNAYDKTALRLEVSVVEYFEILSRNVCGLPGARAVWAGVNILFGIFEMC